mmetsp:Transcript_39159/g.91853  ORF Transcript_39159/g.91853 Transcript_39159/m.91853 type:complete len:394 (-) Transcript_39159:631-1812(-)
MPATNCSSRGLVSALSSSSLCHTGRAPRPCASTGCRAGLNSPRCLASRAASSVSGPAFSTSTSACRPSLSPRAASSPRARTGKARTLSQANTRPCSQPAYSSRNQGRGIFISLLPCGPKARGMQQRKGWSSSEDTAMHDNRGGSRSTQCARQRRLRGGRPTQQPCRISAFLGAEDLVARVAQPRDDVAHLVQVAVDRGRPAAHIGMGRGQGLHALGRGHQHQRTHVLAAARLEQVHRRDHAAGRRQHRVDDQRGAGFQVADKLVEVVDRLQRFMVARQAHHRHLGVGQDVQHAVQHAQAGAQDGHHGDLAAGDLLHLGRAAPALDADLLERKVGRRLVGQQPRDLAGQLTELFGRDVGLAHQPDLVFDQRVLDFDDGHLGIPFLLNSRNYRLR